jgi:sporulation protein YlmC with PRC-barrel domain
VKARYGTRCGLTYVSKTARAVAERLSLVSMASPGTSFTRFARRRSKRPLAGCRAQAHLRSRFERVCPRVLFEFPYPSAVPPSFAAGTISAPMGLGNQTFRRTTMTTASGHTSAIRAKKVLGSNVTDRSGKKIGEVEDVVLDKESNSILFAVIGFGGFLGIAEKYHPVPWAALDYDESQGSYVVDYTKEQLQAAPAGSIDELTRGDGLQFRDRTYDYYKAPRYWETH